MFELNVGGNDYRIKKMSVFDQFHVSRKIAPLISSALPIFAHFAKNARAEEGATEEGATEGELMDKLSSLLLEGFSEASAPLAQALANMPEADSEFVIAKCLKSVQRGTAGHWATVWNTGANKSQFDDIELDTMLILCAQSIKYNLGAFMPGMLSGKNPSHAAMNG